MLPWNIILGLIVGLCCYSTAIEFIVEPFDTIVNYGETVILRCALKDQGKNPLYWQNTDTQQFISMDREVDPYRSFGNKTRERLSIVGDSRYGEYNLHIDNVTNLDAGSYACLYFDVFGYYSRAAEVKVVNPPMKDYPMCMMSPSTPAAIGDDVDLLCVSSGGKPAPMLSWTTDGTSVPSAYVSGGVGGVTSNKHSLKLTEDHRGKVFTCKATHEAFNVPKTCSIIPIGFNVPVYLRPKIKYATEGRRATFACYTDKSLEPTFHWYLGKKLLDVNDPRVTPTKDGVSKLKLRNLRINDNGTHVYCVITNRFGAKKNDSSLLLVFPPYYSGGKGTDKGEVPKQETQTSKDNNVEYEKPTVSNPVTKSGPVKVFHTTTDRSEGETVTSTSTDEVHTQATTKPQTILDQAKSVDTDLFVGRTTLKSNYFVEHSEYVTITPKDHNTFEWKPKEKSSPDILSNQHSDVIENVIESTQTPNDESSYFTLDVTDIPDRGQQTNNFRTVDIVTANRDERWKAPDIASLDKHAFTTKTSYTVDHLKSQRPIEPTAGSTTTTSQNMDYLDSNVGPSVTLTKPNEEVTIISQSQAIPTKITGVLNTQMPEYVTITDTKGKTTEKTVSKQSSSASNILDQTLNYGRSAPSNVENSKSSETVHHEQITTAASQPSSFGTDGITSTTIVTTERKQLAADTSEINTSEMLSSSVSASPIKIMETTNEKDKGKYFKTFLSTFAPSVQLTSNAPNVLSMNSTNQPIELQTYMSDELIPAKFVNNNKLSTPSSTVKYHTPATNKTSTVKLVSQNVETTSPSTDSYIKTEINLNMTTRLLNFMEKSENSTTKATTSTANIDSTVTPFSTEQTKIGISKIYHRSDKVEVTVKESTTNVDSNQSNVNTTRTKSHEGVTQSEMIISEEPYLNNVTKITENISNLNNIITTKATHNSEDIDTSSLMTSSPSTNTENTDQSKLTTQSVKQTLSSVLAHTSDNGDVILPTQYLTVTPSSYYLTPTKESEINNTTSTAVRSTYEATIVPDTTSMESTSKYQTNPITAIVRKIMLNSIVSTSSTNLPDTVSNYESTEGTFVAKTTKDIDVTSKSVTTTQITTPTKHYESTESTSTFKINPITAIVKNILLNSTMSTTSAKVLEVDTTISTNSESRENTVVIENKDIRTTSDSSTPSSIDQRFTTPLTLDGHHDTAINPVYNINPTLQPKVIPFGKDYDKIHPVKISGTVSPSIHPNIYESIGTTVKTESSTLVTSDDLVTGVFTVNLRDGTAPKGIITPETLLKTQNSNETPIKPGNPVIPEEEDEAKTATVRRNGKIILASIVGMAVFSAFILTIFSVVVKCFSNKHDTYHHPRRWS